MISATGRRIAGEIRAVAPAVVPSPPVPRAVIQSGRAPAPFPSARAPRAGAARPRSAGVTAPLLGLCLAASGCVDRTIRITSDPTGAIVWLNEREVGRTPVEVGFVHYGDYAVRLEREGCEPLVTHARATPPVWDLPGPDLVAELLPMRVRSRIDWNFVLQPEQREREPLIERARALRQDVESQETGPAAPSAGDAAPDGNDSHPTERAGHR